MLLGSAFFWLPGTGTEHWIGPLVVWIVGGLESTPLVGGIGTLAAALFSLGTPKDSILEYETHMKNGRLLLPRHGTSEEIPRARDILHRTEASSASLHGEEPSTVGRKADEASGVEILIGGSGSPSASHPKSWREPIDRILVVPIASRQRPGVTK